MALIPIASLSDVPEDMKETQYESISYRSLFSVFPDIQSVHCNLAKLPS